MNMARQEGNSGFPDGTAQISWPRGTKRQRHWQVDRMPPLQSLAFEIDMWRAILVRPTPALLYCKHHTLAKNQYIGAERVASAALAEGCTPDLVISLLVEAAQRYAPNDSRFAAECAALIVASQQNRPKERVMHPGNGRLPRVVVMVTAA